MNTGRFPVLVAGLGLTLAACGSGSEGSAPPVTDARPVANDAVASDDLSESGEFTESDSGEVASLDASEPATSEASTGEDAAAEPVVTDAPEAIAPPEPVVGGRLFAADVQPAAQFDGNPFPDLVVEDIGKDAQVNVKNILPSDRPVLLWAWAPH